MPLEAILISGADSAQLLLGLSPTGKDPVLIVRDVAHEFGVFKAIDETTAGTYTIATPASDEALVLTDIMISSKKKAASTLTLRFTDGTDTVPIYSPDTVQAEVNFGIGLKGRFAGWSGARLEIITVADVVFNATIGYYKASIVETFDTWNSRR